MSRYTDGISEKELAPFIKIHFLEEGDVITIEPGVYLPGVGDIRFKNTLYVAKKRASKAF